MTLKRPITNKRALQALLPLAGISILAAALTGCGGATTNSGAASAPTPNSGPVVYGLNAAAAVAGLGNNQGEASGLTFNVTTGTGTATTTTTEAALIAATGYKTVNGQGPLPVYQSNFPNAGTTSSPGLPLGFTPNSAGGTGGSYVGSAATIAALPTNYAGTLQFGAYVSTGAVNKVPVDLNPSSIVLTSSEAPTFSQPLTYDPNFGSGVLASAQYKTAQFPIPAFLQTTGLHNLHTTIADVAGQSSTTDFSVVALAPTDSAALVSIDFIYKGNPYAVSGATATIDNPLPNVAAYQDVGVQTSTTPVPKTSSYSDVLGSVLLFAAPGPHKITINGLSPIDGTTPVTGTVTVTLVAGQVDTTHSITAVAGTTPATAAAIARYKMLHHLK